MQRKNRLDFGPMIFLQRLLTKLKGHKRWVMALSEFFAALRSPRFGKIRCSQCSSTKKKPLRWRPGSSQLEHVCPPIIFIMMRIPGKFSSVFFWSFDNKDNDPWGLSTNIQWFCMLAVRLITSETDHHLADSWVCWVGSTPGNIYSYFTQAHQGRSMKTTSLCIIISQWTYRMYIYEHKPIQRNHYKAGRSHYSRSSGGGAKIFLLLLPCLESITIQLSLPWEITKINWRSQRL